MMKLRPWHALAGTGILLLGVLAFWGAIGYVAFHFIMKFW
jgi:hypothetical protein